MTAGAEAARESTAREQSTDPHTLLLSNGTLSSLVSTAGGGGIRRGRLAVTRWTSDPTRDADGVWLYVRDVESGAWWRAAPQPGGRTADSCRSRLRSGVVELEREDDGITTRLEICIAADADVEIRRATFINATARPRRLALTTYAELAMNTPAADSGHPAFSRLFVQTAYRREAGALVAWRRLRSPDDEPLWVAHLLVSALGVVKDAELETDRMRFIGRGRSTSDPRAMDASVRLSGSTGNVLDPVLALRATIEIPAHGEARIASLVAAAPDENVLAQARRFASLDAVDAECAAAESSGAPAIRRAEGASRREPARARPADPGPIPTECLHFDNGYGGFSDDGSEYVIRVPGGPHGVGRPPLPWTNVVANESAGFIVSESGAGYTWAANSRENRLTPWFNDPVSDPFGEALYVRDEESGAFWSPTPGPVSCDEPTEVRHGLGYTRFRSTRAGIGHDLWMFVPPRDAVRIARLCLTNQGTTRRRLSVYSFAQWALGGSPPERGRHVRTWFDGQTGSILAVNPERGEFAGRVAFAAVGAPHAAIISRTADRTEWLGVHGEMRAPAAVVRGGTLGERSGADLDPCAAFRVELELRPAAAVELVFLLGEADDEEGARAIVRRHAGAASAARALDDAREQWRSLTDALQVETPDPAIDLMVNRWLPYQNLSCRIRGRSAFYQSGGAYGFRDQLQDSAALLYLDPGITRRQILLHAAHQFVEGDVMHWWHPPLDRGMRTRFSDDLLWLPYVTSFYVSATGDAELLDEPAPFLCARPLEPGEDEAFLLPQRAGVSGTVYEHCCRAIDRSLTRGAHKLPLMGVGDWNDGMNRVGREGRGESVWLGFFLFDILGSFTPICEARGDAARAARYRAYREALGRALNADDGGWDGRWYRRAYYDDGTPLGSASGDECRIDVIAQAWSVLSGAAPPERATLALDEMERHLVSEREGIVRLLTPAFDRTPHDPGYIKGYLPGVRENGGQYTHGALWAVRALAEAGRRERAATLLSMLSPVSRGGTPDAIATYQTEPYVIAADVYGVAPHVGRGGWTWYTGSAGWMYRVALESILGFELRDGAGIVLRPCIPDGWPGFTIRYRPPDDESGTRYEIRVSRATGREGAPTTARGGAGVTVADGAVRIPLARDGAVHRIEIALGGDVGRRYVERRGE